jgi:WD40 repeat protein
VPYTLGDIKGVIEIRRDGERWTVHRDRGEMERGGWWRPFPKDKGATARELREFELPKDATVMCVAFSPDGRRVAAGTMEGAVWLWEVEKSKERRKLQLTDGGLLTGSNLFVAFSPDGKRIMVGCADSTLRLLDAATGKEVHQVKGCYGPRLATFSRDGRRILFRHSSDRTIRVWDVEEAKELRRFEVWQLLETVSLSPDGRSFVIADVDKTVHFGDLESGKLVRALKGHRYRVVDALFSPDGRRLVSVDGWGKGRVWDVKTGKCLREFGDRSNLVYSAAVSPDGRRVLLGATNEMQLWDLERGKLLTKVEGLSGKVVATFSPDGRFALGGEMRGRVRLWELPKPAEGGTTKK